MPRAPSTRPPSAGSGSGARSRARNNPKTRSLNAFSIAQSTAAAARRRRRRPSKHTTTAADPDPDTTTSSSKNTRRADSASIDGGSDSDGGHWRVGVGSGDDSESDIDSDEALGASDEERFAGFAFRGSSSSGNKKEKKKKGVVTLDESDDDDDDDDEEEDAEEEEDDGEGFVDLSEMLDRATPSGSESGEEAEEAAGKLRRNRPKKRAAPESESEDDSAGGLDLEEPSMSEADDGSGSGSDSDSSDSFAHFSEEEEEEDDGGGDPAALAALQSRIAALPSGSKHASKRARLDNDPNEGKTPNEYNLAPTPHTKLTVNDLLPTIADRTLKKSLKTLSSDSTTTKSTGMQAGKLAAPLPKRQQDRIDRAAAYVQTTTALGRWAATVKTQREAEHLRFPLPNAPNAPVATPQRLLSLSATEARGGAQTELEATVSRILKESNMASERKLAEFEELQTNRMSVEEVQRRTAELRMARELMYREELRAKRVKKIKSKAYRRVHKKERARQEQAVEEALALERGGREAEAEAGEEAMERERRRAEERMTLRHKQSRWAKGMRESGRSVWDDEAQEGAVEMARRAEELTRRIRGKGVRGEFGESGSSSSSSSEDGEDEEDEDDDAFDEEGVELRRKLAKDIEKAEASLGASGAGSRLGGRLVGMKFMQTAEAAKRKENDAQLEELKSMLMDADRPGRGSEGEDDEDEKEQEEQQHKQASGRMTFRPGKKEKEKKKPSAADRSEFEEQDLSGQEQQDEDGEEEQEDEEEDKVTLVNRANAAAASSSTAPKNPFTAPRTTAGAAGGKHTSFGAGNDTAAAAAAAGNPWLPQDAPPHPQRKQPTLSSSTKTESRTERSSKKLARTRHAALAPAGAEAEVEIDTSATLQLAPKKQQPTPADADGDDGEDEDEGEDEVDAKDIHLIPAHKGGGKAAQSQRALVRRAFAGDDVVAQFVEEKRAVVAAEGDRVVDERLPGWGSWAGEGLPQSQTQAARDDRFVKVVKGVVAPERRKDRRLARVVVNEKRVKKNIKYHASALPHVFETKQQYERSLRIPIGPEWATKTTFQDATMPRVVVKRGVVVEPISAPFK